MPLQGNSQFETAALDWHCIFTGVARYPLLSSRGVLSSVLGWHLIRKAPLCVGSRQSWHGSYEFATCTSTSHTAHLPLQGSTAAAATGGQLSLLGAGLPLTGITGLASQGTTKIEGTHVSTWGLVWLIFTLVYIFIQAFHRGAQRDIWLSPASFLSWQIILWGISE